MLNHLSSAEDKSSIVFALVAQIHFQNKWHAKIMVCVLVSFLQTYSTCFYLQHTHSILARA